MVKVLKASQIPVKPINMLLYGPPGFGKTTAAATAPNPIIVDWENKAEKTLKWIEALKNTPIIQPTPSETIEEIVSFCISEKYQTICWDTTDRLFDQLLYRHLREVRRTRPRIDDYLEVMTVIKRQVIRLQAANIHTVFIAHQVEEKITGEDKQTRQIIRPNIPTRLRAEIPAIVDMVGYMGKPKIFSGQNGIWIKPTAESNWYCKTAWNQLPEAVPPNIGHLFANIYKFSAAAASKSSPSSSLPPSPLPAEGTIPLPSAAESLEDLWNPSDLFQGWQELCVLLSVPEDKVEKILLGYLEYSYQKASIKELTPEEQEQLFHRLRPRTASDQQMRRTLENYIQANLS